MSTKRVFIVDDDEMIRSIMKAVCLSHGWVSLIYSNVREALEAFKTESSEVDVAVLDLCIGNDWGGDLAINLRKIRPDLPVVFMTGSDDEIICAVQEQVPCAEVLRKPFSIALMQSLIERSNLNDQSPPLLTAAT